MRKAFLVRGQFNPHLLSLRSRACKQKKHASLRAAACLAIPQSFCELRLFTKPEMQKYLNLMKLHSKRVVDAGRSSRVPQPRAAETL